MMQDNSACAQQQSGTDMEYVFLICNSFFNIDSRKYFKKNAVCYGWSKDLGKKSIFFRLGKIQSPKASIRHVLHELGLSLETT